jgi:hypothetical protein
VGDPSREVPAWKIGNASRARRRSLAKRSTPESLLVGTRDPRAGTAIVPVDVPKGRIGPCGPSGRARPLHLTASSMPLGIHNSSRRSRTTFNNQFPHRPSDTRPAPCYRQGAMATDARILASRINARASAGSLRKPETWRLQFPCCETKPIPHTQERRCRVVDGHKIMRIPNKSLRQHRLPPQTGRPAAAIPVLQNEANSAHSGVALSGSRCPRQHRLPPQTGGPAAAIPLLRNEANFPRPAVAQSGRRCPQDNENTE